MSALRNHVSITSPTDDTAGEGLDPGFHLGTLMTQVLGKMVSKVWLAGARYFETSTDMEGHPSPWVL
jgi:hypothetical protein